MTDVQDDDTILVVNGDTYTDLDFSEPVQSLASRGADALMVCAVREVRIDYGVLISTRPGGCALHRETHLYLFGQHGDQRPAGRCTAFHAAGPSWDMPELLWHLSESGGKVACMQTSAVWRDLGRPDDLILANEDARGT